MSNITNDTNDINDTDNTDDEVMYNESDNGSDNDSDNDSDNESNNSDNTDTNSNIEDVEDLEDVEDNEDNFDDEIEDIDNMNLIPCEFCEEMVNFEDYTNHTQNCIRNYNRRVRRFNTLNTFMNVLNSPNFNNLVANINDIRNPLEAENINENDENVEYTELNETNDENGDNVNNEDVNNTDEISDVGDVITDDNNAVENNVEPIVDGIETDFFTNRTIFNTGFTTSLNNIPSILLYNNMDRDLINNIQINIGNLHNLTRSNNATEYDFNLLIQQLMGGNVKIGVKDINKVINVLKPNDLKDDDTCSICLDNLKDVMNNECKKAVKINLPVETICGHRYCRDCICKWLKQNKNCPVCNKKFEEESSENIDESLPNLVNYSDNSDDDSLPDLIDDDDVVIT